jgi:PAS domain S-box-containing protein
MAIDDPATSDVAARLAEVRRLEILAAPPRGAFDRIAAMAAHAFGAPMAFVSAAGYEEGPFLSSLGLDAEEVAQAIALCVSLTSGAEPCVVADASQDPRTNGHPLVTGEPGLRFLAGIALRAADGSAVGTLCVLDVEPHPVLAPRSDFLVHLGGLVTEQLELRRSTRLAIGAAEERLHDVEDLVRALQSSLLPPTVPRIPFLDVAAHYQPASRSEVGGDFYDAFPIEDDVWGFVIGDVCGKGPQAAGRTSCARYSIRAAAMQIERPSEVLKCTNHLLYVEGGSLPDAPFVTAQFARARVRNGTAVVQLASGGHPLPTVLRAQGQVEVVGSLGTLLGVLPDVDIPDAEFELHAGDTVVLITDGVHDSGRPRALLQEGLEAVLRGCRRMSPADIVDRVLEEVVAAQRDDVAILAVAARPVILAERAAVLEPDLDSAGRARRLLRSALGEADRLRWEDAGALALTEVVTNAVLHAHTSIDVRLEVSSDQLRVEVQDANPYLPRQRPHDEQATVGRGMGLVAAVTDSCGVRSVGSEGKVVWFALGDAPAETSTQDVAATWDVEDWEEPPPPQALTRPVVLEDIPAMLWLAALQHHDTLLRELVLYVAEHDDVQVDLTRADLARQLISAPVIKAVEEAQRAGTALPALPADHPAPLPAVPKHLTLTLAVPETIGPVYAALQHALDEAERLARAGKLLARPGLPEIVAVRNWAHKQVLGQLEGSSGSPWPGTAQRHFETADLAQVGDGWWHDALVADSEQGVVAADDANRIVAVSRPLADLLGWQVEDLVGRRVVTIIPLRLREAHVAGFTRHLTTGEAHVLGVPLVLPVLRADGTEIRCRFLIERAPQRSARSVYVAWIDAETTADEGRRYE